MKELICSNCGHSNAANVRYCQRCGAFLTPKKTLADEVRSWDLRSLAGTGRRDVNIAPLFTAQGSGQPASVPAPASVVDPLPDGRWYCPDCGTLHSSSEMSCKNCGKVR